MGYKQKFKNIRPSVQLAPCCLLTACRSEWRGKGERGTSMRNNFSPPCNPPRVSPLNLLGAASGASRGRAFPSACTGSSPTFISCFFFVLSILTGISVVLLLAVWRPFSFQVFSFELRAVWWNNGAEQLIPVHSPCALWLYKSLSCTSLRSLFSRLSSLSFCQMTSVILLWTLSLRNFLIYFFLRWAHQSHLHFAIRVTKGFA